MIKKLFLVVLAVLICSSYSFAQNRITSENYAKVVDYVSAKCIYAYSQKNLKKKANMAKKTEVLNTYQLSNLSSVPDYEGIKKACSIDPQMNILKSLEQYKGTVLQHVQAGDSDEQLIDVIMNFPTDHETLKNLKPELKKELTSYFCNGKASAVASPKADEEAEVQTEGAETESEEGILEDEEEEGMSIWTIVLIVVAVVAIAALLYRRSRNNREDSLQPSMPKASINVKPIETMSTVSPKNDEPMVSPVKTIKTVLPDGQIKTTTVPVEQPAKPAQPTQPSQPAQPVKPVETKPVTPAAASTKAEPVAPKTTPIASTTGNIDGDRVRKLESYIHEILLKYDALEKKIARIESNGAPMASMGTEAMKNVEKVLEAQTERIAQIEQILSQRDAIQSEPNGSVRVHHTVMPLPADYPTTLYADCIIDDCFNKVTEESNEGTFFVLDLQSATTASFTVHVPATEIILHDPSFLEGCDTQILEGRNNVVVMEQGQCQRIDGKWHITKRANVIVK